MICPRCGKEAEMLFSDGCLTCHEKRTDLLRASLARVESGTAATPPPPRPAVVAPVKKKPVEPKKPDPMSKTQQIRWTPEESRQVATEVERLFPGEPFAAKAVKQAQDCLPPDRRKTSIGPYDIKKIRDLIPGAKSPRPGRGGGRSKPLAKVSRRRPAVVPEPAVLQPVIAEALPAPDSLSDLIVRAVLNTGVQALEKAASRLRSVTA